MNIRRKTQINDFERLDGEGDIDCDIDISGPQSKNGAEYPTSKTSDHYQAIKKSHSVKAIAKAKKLVKKSRYSSLDGAFPTAAVVNSDNKERKSTIDLTPRSTVPIPIQSVANLPTKINGESGDEFYFEANFEEVEAAHNKDHYFEAIFEDDCSGASDPVPSSKGNDDRPSTPNTFASSSISSDSRPSTPGSSVFPSTSAEDTSVDIGVRSEEMSTPDTSENKTTKKKFLGKKSSSYQKLDYRSTPDEKVQLELDQRLKAIHKLKDVTIEQSKKIKKMQLSNKANKVRLILFRKEITYLRLQNADLKERVTKLEDDLKTAKDDTIVSEEEANRMCTALVLIREQIDVSENRAEKMDGDIEVEDLFVGGGGGGGVSDFFSTSFSNAAELVEGKGGERDATTEEDIDITFDAFGLYVKDVKEERDAL